MKKCNTCSLTKPLTEFYRDKSFKDGYRANCKECKDKSTIAWRNKNREKYNAGQREQHKKHYQRNRLYRYGITPQEYDDLLKEQNGLCKICSKPPKKTRPLVIDHCHKTRNVRNLLCYKCNRDMAVIDDEQHLTKLIAYRDIHKLKRIA